MNNYSDETIKQCINMLLLKLDQSYGEGMHWRGQTPDWYVAAAMISCDTEDTRNEVCAIITKEVARDEAVYSRTR